MANFQVCLEMIHSNILIRLWIQKCNFTKILCIKIVGNVSDLRMYRSSTDFRKFHSTNIMMIQCGIESVNIKIFWYCSRNPFVKQKCFNICEFWSQITPWTHNTDTNTHCILYIVQCCIQRTVYVSFNDVLHDSMTWLFTNTICNRLYMSSIDYIDRIL